MIAKTLRPVGYALLGLAALAGGIKSCKDIEDSKNVIEAQKKECTIREPKIKTWILDPESGKMIECKPIHVDTIRVKDVNIADSLINEGLKIDLPRLDSIMQTNYAKGLLSVDTVKKAAKVIR